MSNFDELVAMFYYLFYDDIVRMYKDIDGDIVIFLLFRKSKGGEMMSREYNIDTVSLSNVAAKTSSNASEYKANLNSLIKTNDILRSFWTGEAANKYMELWNEKRASVEKLQEWLVDFAERVESVSRSANRTNEDIMGDYK